jgi:MerR HTH family regulatory protein
MAETLSPWITEKELIAEAQSRELRVTPRTLRKWREKRLLSYTKLGRETLYPRDWSSELKIIKSRNASA